LIGGFFKEKIPLGPTRGGPKGFRHATPEEKTLGGISTAIGCLGTGLFCEKRIIARKMGKKCEHGLGIVAKKKREQNKVIPEMGEGTEKGTGLGDCGKKNSDSAGRREITNGKGGEKKKQK